MLSPEEFILSHADKPYNPVKAHEYYMRTRKLHPRKTGVSYTVSRGGGKTVKLSAKQLAEQQAYAAHRVSAIRDRLTKLNKLLAQKLHDEKQRERDAKKKPTSAEKHKAAQESKKYREKNQQKVKTAAKQAAAKKSHTTPSKTSKTPTTVTGLEDRILATKASLKSAVEKQRELASAHKNG